MSMKRLIIGTCAVLAVIASAVYVKYNLSEWAMYYTKQTELRKALWLWKLDALTGDFYTYPDHREQQIGELYRRLWDWDGARKYYEHILEGKDPEQDAGKYLTAFRHLAIACLKSGMEARGREIVNRLVSNNPDSQITGMILSDLVMRQLAYPEIAPQIERYVMENEAHSGRVNYEDLGRYYVQIHQPVMALKVLPRVETSNPHKELAPKILTAMALEQLGRQDEVDSICVALTIAAGDDEVSLTILSNYCRLEHALIQQGLQWVRHALAIIESSQEAAPKQQNRESFFYTLYAELLFCDGQIPEAVNAMTRGIKLTEEKRIRRYYENLLAEYRKALNPV